MSVPLLKTLEVNPAVPARAAVIWLHGLGANARDFEPVVPDLQFSGDPAVRFVFPNAPLRPVTINAGLTMRAWFDVVTLDRNAAEDEEGIRESAGALEALIERERERGVAADKIVLAGFSQGGAIALHTGLRHAGRLAGILALSTYVPLSDTLGREASEVGLDVPIFMAHGRHDSLIPMTHGQTSRQFLEALGYTVEWHDYPMEHAVCIEEIQDIAVWLQRVLTGVGEG